MVKPELFQHPVVPQRPPGKVRIAASEVREFDLDIGVVDDADLVQLRPATGDLADLGLIEDPPEVGLRISRLNRSARCARTGALTRREENPWRP